MDLISDVCLALYRRNVPMSLVVDWEHHGQDAWDTCEDARKLLHLLSYADHRVSVRSTCACVRTVLQYIPSRKDIIPRASIETAERWVLGEATEQECLDAYRVSCASSDDFAALYIDSRADIGLKDRNNAARYAFFSSTRAIEAVGCTPDVAYVCVSHAAHYAAAATAYAALSCFSEGVRDEWQRAYDQKIGELADLVRQNATCPAAKQLLRT